MVYPQLVSHSQPRRYSVSVTNPNFDARMITDLDAAARIIHGAEGPSGRNRECADTDSGTALIRELQFAFLGL